jgi:hypothetical protein
MKHAHADMSECGRNSQAMLPRLGREAVVGSGGLGCRGSMPAWAGMKKSDDQLCLLALRKKRRRAGRADQVEVVDGGWR